MQKLVNCLHFAIDWKYEYYIMTKTGVLVSSVEIVSISCSYLQLLDNKPQDYFLASSWLYIYCIVLYIYVHVTGHVHITLLKLFGCSIIKLILYYYLLLVIINFCRLYDKKKTKPLYFPNSSFYLYNVKVK